VDVSADELDKKDQAIGPHDFATAGSITDDDIQVAGIAVGVNLDVFLDSCFSGTATRVTMETVSSGFGERVTARPSTIRFVEPPAEHSIFADATRMLPVKGILWAKGSGNRDAVVVPGLNHVLWSGCRDNELSGEAISAATCAASSPTPSVSACAAPA
jgi:metacaspase-1